jgi:ParB family chromosome partitioning protein
MAQPQKGLGKGLSALMGDNNAPARAEKAAAPALAGQGGAAATAEQPTNTLPVTALTAGKYQPRRHFDEEGLSELADSIERHGLMQPIVVRPLAVAGKFEIIAGERRFRAAKLAKLTDVPVIIRDVTDEEALELALIENIQRADLNPLEEAAGYQRLMDEFGYTQEKLAPVVGKSRSHIANLLRLLKLPESIKKRIDSGELTMGHARALLMAKNPEELAKKIIEIGLSVRQAEDLAKGIVQPQTSMGQGSGTPSPKNNASHAVGARGAATKSEDVLQLEEMLANNLGLRVSISQRSGQAGEVVISYDSLVQLDEILRRLGGSI